MGPTSPRVSVVIAVRDGERYVGRTLESALAQSFDDLEVIVVDDGSTDTTADIVQAHARLDERVRLISRAATGVSAARNHAVAEARGEFIALLDADDLWHPDYVRSHVERLDDDPSAAAVWSPPFTIDESDRVIDEVLPFDRATIARTHGWVLLPMVYRYFPACGSSLTLRKSALIAAGSFDSSHRVSEDLALMLRIAENHRMAVAPRPLVGYRQVPGSLSASASTNIVAHLEILSEVCGRVPWIPRRVVRWGRSGRYVAAASRALWAGERRKGLGFGVRAVMLDPAVLLHPQALPRVVDYLIRRTPPRPRQERFPHHVEPIDLRAVDADTAHQRRFYRWWAATEQRRHQWMQGYEIRARRDRSAR